MKKKNILFLLLVILALAGIAAVMMVIGRGHTIYFDTHSFEYEGKTYEPPYKVEIFVPGEEEAVAKLREGERGMTTCIGQSLEFTVVVTQEKGGQEQAPVTYTVKLPYDLDGIVFNLPAFFNGVPAEECYEEFIPVVTEDPEEEAPGGDEFGMDDMGALGDI